MARHNSCFVVGNLGANPIERARNAKSGPVVGFTVAENVQAFDEKTNTFKTVHTNWFQATAFGNLGERVMRALKKGDKVIVQGRMKVSKYQTKTGEERNGFEIVADEVAIWQPLPSAQASASAGGAGDSEAIEEEAIPF